MKPPLEKAGEPAAKQSAEPTSAGIIAPRLVGASEAEAKAIAQDAGFAVRVTSRDNAKFPSTMDYREDRLNLAVEDGIVKSATVG